jgi:hypothetical protein
MVSLLPLSRNLRQERGSLSGGDNLGGFVIDQEYKCRCPVGQWPRAISPINGMSSAIIEYGDLIAAAFFMVEVRKRAGAAIALDSDNGVGRFGL